MSQELTVNAGEARMPGVFAAPARACTLAGRCSGCGWIGRPYSEQLEAKRQHLLDRWCEAGLPALTLPLPVHSAGEDGLRSRADLTLWRQEGELTLGLYSQDRQTLLDLEDCPQYSPALLEWFRDFRRDLPEIDYGSLRLRVSPAGDRGVWLDFPNATIKHLLEARDWLLRLSARAHVEIGQKHKPLEIGSERLGLRKELELRPWFETYVLMSEIAETRDDFSGSRTRAAGARAASGREEGESACPGWRGGGSFSPGNFEGAARAELEASADGSPGGLKLRSLPLYCTVGSFTQPGFLPNRLLIETLLRALAGLRPARWLELGAGIGNFSLPLASTGAEVTALELAPSALEGLQRSAREAGLDRWISPQVGNFLKADLKLLDLLRRHEGLLVDPPRSGAGALAEALTALPPQERPGVLVYVSCFPESMVRDLAMLLPLGYAIRSLEGVDQFPQSPHCEWVGVLVLEDLVEQARPA